MPAPSAFPSDKVNTSKTDVAATAIINQFNSIQFASSPFPIVVDELSQGHHNNFISSYHIDNNNSLLILLLLITVFVIICACRF